MFEKWKKPKPVPGELSPEKPENREEKVKNARLAYLSGILLSSQKVEEQDAKLWADRQAETLFARRQEILKMIDYQLPAKGNNFYKDYTKGLTTEDYGTLENFAFDIFPRGTDYRGIGTAIFFTLRLDPLVRERGGVFSNIAEDIDRHGKKVWGSEWIVGTGREIQEKFPADQAEADLRV